jgi:hypothetical protein
MHYGIQDRHDLHSSLTTTLRCAAAIAVGVIIKSIAAKVLYTWPDKFERALPENY